MRLALAAIVVLPCFCLTSESRGAGVDLEVILAADVSRSIDDAEFDLQRKGYAAAVSDPRVLTAIRGRPGAAIRVCFIEWSGDEDQQVVVDWSELRDEEDAGTIAAAILAAPRSFMGRTSISAAIDFAMAQFAKSKWQAGRHIIDISGDGTNNSGRPVTEARDQAISRGVTINGLAIINDKPNLGYSAHTQPPAALLSTECDRRIQFFPARGRRFQFVCQCDGKQARQRNRRRQFQRGKAAIFAPATCARRGEPSRRAICLLIGELPRGGLEEKASLSDRGRLSRLGN